MNKNTDPEMPTSEEINESHRIVEESENYWVSDPVEYIKMTREVAEELRGEIKPEALIKIDEIGLVGEIIDLETDTNVDAWGRGIFYKTHREWSLALGENVSVPLNQYIRILIQIKLYEHNHEKVDVLPYMIPAFLSTELPSRTAIHMLYIDIDNSIFEKLK